MEEFFHTNKGLIGVISTDKGAILKTVYNNEEYMVGVKTKDLNVINNFKSNDDTKLYEYSSHIEIWYMPDVGECAFVSLMKENCFEDKDDCYLDVYYQHTHGSLEVYTK